MTANYQRFAPRGVNWACIRTFVSRIIVVLLAAACTSCGHQEPSKPQTKPVVEHKSVSSAPKVELAVAAAADLKFAFEDLKAEFQKAHPNIEVKVTYGASGSFYSRLSNRAPFDVFLSADSDYPRKLSEQELAIAKTQFRYAIGHIELWVLKDSALDLEKNGIQVLLDPAVGKIAIANPKHAPYGRAAEAALKSLGIYDQIQDRLVLGENMAQAFQYVESGAADIGIVARSLTMAPATLDKGRSWSIPDSAYPKMEQVGVILSWVQNREAAESLKSFLVSERGQEILKSYGFDVTQAVPEAYANP